VTSAIFTLDRTAAVVTIVAPLCALAALIVRMTLGSRLRSIEGRIAGHDEDIQSIKSTAVDTRISVAKIEGYLARNNGGGERLPETSESAQIAADAQPVTVPPDDDA
jgi:hypothetical protein